MGGLFEKDFCQMSNGALDKLCKFRIGGEANQVLHAIIRKTWGWGKREDAIALSSLEDMTGLPKRSVCRALRKLEAMKVIIGVRNSAHSKPTTYCINETYSEWRGVSKLRGVSIVRTRGVSIVRTKGVSKMTHSKDTLKDNSNKNTLKDISSPKISGDHQGAIRYFCDLYFEKHQIKYHFTKGKDGKLVKQLLATYGFDFFCRLVDQIYVTNDEFIINKGRVTIGVLSACANKLTQEIVNRKDMRSAFTEKERQSLKSIAQGLDLDHQPLELKNEQ